MIFSTLEFLVFFAIVFPVGLALRHGRFFHPFLLAASFYFYMSWNPQFILLLLASTLLDFFVAPRIAVSQTDLERKQWLWFSLIGNFGLLGFFKYANFVIDAVNVALPPSLKFSNLDITLPVGISFYTFQTLSYSLDVYYGRIQPEKSFVKFALFVSFFPQLVAGPIVRAREFLPQLYQNVVVNLARVKEGLDRFLIGLVKKLLIADSLAPYIDRVYSNPSLYDAPTLWLATVAFGMQIYCDFSGYSDMAIGTARCFGFHLPENFNMPYFAANIREFWQRWHMTLSTWLRDYLYIPLGGSRCSPLLNLRNLMITMLLGGLWHGASWKFVIWGALHGCYLIIHRFWSSAKTNVDWQVHGPARVVLILSSTLLTFLCVTLAWVYFRAEDAATATTMVQRMVSWDNSGEFLSSSLLLITGVALITAHFLCTFTDYRSLYQKLPTPFKVVGYGVIFYLLSVSSIRDNTPFIYFQF